MQPQEVLDFWFTDRVQALCFERNEDFDAEIRSRFGEATAEAQGGRLEAWQETPEGTLALVLLLDQMPRNIHRGTPLAFASDVRALEIAQQAVKAGLDRHLTFPQRRFLYLPFEHSEDPAVHKQGLALFASLAVECAPEHNVDAAVQLVYAARHAEIVFRFGRYPHRNTVLGRISTAEEEAFLEEPLSSF
jgi:uncharacterized protein (DUF924 family)